jgi:hypothetical protein
MHCDCESPLPRELWTGADLDEVRLFCLRCGRDLTPALTGPVQ